MSAMPFEGWAVPVQRLLASACLYSFFFFFSKNACALFRTQAQVPWQSDRNMQIGY